MRGLGCIPDSLERTELDESTRHVAQLIGGFSAPEPPESLDHSDLLDYVPDQGRTGRCVAWYVSSGSYLAGQASGRPIARPSPKWNYDVARYEVTPGVLVDEGSSCAAMLDGLARHGMVSEARLPSTEANVNEPPPFDADLLGADALLTGYYKITGDVPWLIRSALAYGHFPGIAIVVNQSFQDVGPSDDVYDEPAGAEVGRHMLTCIGYRPGAVKILNSWGTGWGANGFCWISDRFLSSHYTFDARVITAAPRLT